MPISNIKFHEKLDQLLAKEPQKHVMDEIQDVLHKYISYISKKDAEDYLPKIKVKLQEAGVDHPVIEEINVLCKKLILTDEAIKNLPRNPKILNLSVCKNLTDEAIKYLSHDLQLEFPEEL